MVKKLLLYLLVFTFCQKTLQDEEDNLVDVVESPVEEIANEILNDGNFKNLGGALNNLMQSDMGKQLGNTILSGLTSGEDNPMMSQLLQGMGSLMQQNSASDAKRGEIGSSDGGIPLSPQLIGSILGMLNQQPMDGGGGLDMGTIAQLMMGMANTDSSNGYLGLTSNILGMITNTLSNLDTRKTEEEHADHSWMLPPIVEKFHVYVETFLNSEMGATLMENIGANKALKIFADEEGKFSYPKFVELFENHSFRKHWISMVTKKIAGVISYFADPQTQKKFMTTFTLFVNNYLKGLGVPKTALFDPSRPTESLTAVANYFSKRFLGQKIDSKKYIQPGVVYIQELLNLAQDRGMVGTGLDSDLLSHRIADTINLEIIEPIVRVNRAYRFATKVPTCDRYVLCLVNQGTPNEEESIPGLKSSLSKFTSIVASWFLSDKGDSSFWTLYSVSMEESNCQEWYLEECHDFHIEEIKVTTEYVHSEL